MNDWVRRLLEHAIPVRDGDGAIAVLMFVYSFLAMACCNILKPLTRSTFISDLGAANLPYLLLASGIVIGVLMHWYITATARLARQHVIPVTQAAIIGLLIIFSFLLRAPTEWVAVAFYLFGQILGVLLISEFWTLANDVYDARQAKRLFGFIGAGASLGGAAGAAIVVLLVHEAGPDKLVLLSAAALGGCLGIVVMIGRRHAIGGASPAADDADVGGREAIRLLLQSRHLRIAALAVACAAAGAAVVEQQLNMAAEAIKGHEGDAGIAAFLAQVIVYTSIVGFVLQVVVTSRIHRSLGLLFALILLPVALGSMAVLILLTGAVWAPQAARVLDSTLRYTVDKTSREVLFLPLPSDIKYRAKPFIDVTMDRVAKGVTAVVILVLIQPWGFALDWRRLSYASIAIMALWIATALVARRQYFNTLRQNIGGRKLDGGTGRTEVGPATLEALVKELSNPDPAAVLDALGMLEALDKRDLISPLLLDHESPQVRARALRALTAVRSQIPSRLQPAAAQLAHDPDAGVRAAALHALTELSHEDALILLRQYLTDPEPQVAVTAATALAQSDVADDVDAAELTLQSLIGDSGDAGVSGRREVAAALADISAPRFRPMLISLIYDRDPGVVSAAIASARSMGAADGLFLPALISLLGRRVLKAAAREALAGYGEAAVGALAHAIADPRESLPVRRHIPTTLALIPTQGAMDALIRVLDDPDRSLRLRSIAAIEKLHRRGSLICPVAVVEKLALQEASRYCDYLCERHDVMRAAAPGTLLVRALDERLERTLDCIYRLLGLLYDTDDVAAARYSIEHGDSRRRAAAVEYLDNLLKGQVRKRVLPILDETSEAGRLRHAYLTLQTRPRDFEDIVARVLHEQDPELAAAAIHVVAHHRLWALSGDLEFIQGHPSADAHVAVEAAAWALRVRDGGGVPGGDSLPIVELADRVRLIPMFEFASVDELVQIAAAGEEARHPAGHELPSPDTPPDYVQFLLEGTVRSLSSGPTREIDAPAVLGLEDVLQRTRPTVSIQAATPVVCLRVDAGELLAMVCGNARLAQGLFRTLLARAAWNEPQGCEPSPSLPGSIDRALMLRKHPLLARATPAQLLALVQVATEVPMEEGRVLVERGDPPAVFQVLNGELRLETAAGATVLAPGMTGGLADTLSSSAASARVVVARSGRALRIERDDLFAVLIDHVDLMEGLFNEILILPRKVLPGIPAQA